MNIFLVIILGVLSGILYHWGGKGGRWYFNTKVRDFGVPLVALLALFIMGEMQPSAWVSILLLFGALTISGKKKGKDSRWWNWLLLGFLYALAWLPFCYFTGNMLGLACYAIVVSSLTMVESEMINDVTWEEGLRGFLIVACMPLLFVR